MRKWDSNSSRAPAGWVLPSQHTWLLVLKILLGWQVCLKAPLSFMSLCRKILFSCDPVAILFPSGHLYLDIGYFKEGSLENTKFRVNPWLILKPWVVWSHICPVDGVSVSSDAIPTSDWGLGVFLQQSRAKKIKGRERPKTVQGKPKLGVFIFALIFCSGLGFLYKENPL